jgi:endonuclease YncB( thermonuclease family)
MLNTTQKPILIGLTCLTFLALLLQYLPKPTRQLPSSYEGKVIKVADGDTITIRTSKNEKIKVRLTGIDAPESNQPFGKASKEKLASFIANMPVRIEAYKNDRNGRVLAKVWVQPSDCASCGKTLNVNHAQILAGMAWWYRRYAKELSDEDRGRYESAEDESRKRKRGLWSARSPVAPWDWRRGVRGEMDEQCGSKKYCRDMTNCSEAKLYLNQCGLRGLDGDSDGIPCESLCPG